MTKKELVDGLKAKAFVSRFVGEATQVGNEADGIKVYHQNYFEISGEAADIKKVAFYVVDEGQESEAAYYLVDQMPKSTVASKMVIEAEVIAPKLKVV